MTLVPLFDLTQQFNNKNGAILVGGRLYVYYIGRTDLATTWADEDAQATNPNPVLLDNNGRAPVFVDDSYAYTLVVCDRNGVELFSQDITPGGAGSVGGRIVYHDETLTGNGTVASLLGANTFPLGVDETMTAYTGVAEGRDALILGVNGDWFNNTFGSALNDKVDWSAFEECCASVKGSLSGKADLSILENYYNKTEINSALSNTVTYEFLNDNVYKKYQTSSKEELASAFASAFASAGAGGGDRTPWISGGKEIASMGYLQPGQWFQVLSSFDLTGNKNHFIGVKGGAYNFPTTAMFYDWLDLGQYMPQDYFNNFISASYNPNINALYNSAGWLMYNKLDISAFSAWSADYGPDQAETYTVTGGNWIDISADDENKLTTISVTGLDNELQNASGTLKNEINDLTSQLSSFSSTTLNTLANKKDKQNELHLSDNGNVVTALHQSVNGDVSADFAPVGDSFVPWISGSKVIADTQTMTGNMIIQILSSFDLSGYRNHNIGVKGGTYRFPNNYELASGINQTNTFLTNSAFNIYTDLMNGYINDLYFRDGFFSGRIDYVSGQVNNKLDKVFSSNFYPMTGNPSGFLTTQTDWTNTIKAASSNAYNQATAHDPDMSKYIPYSSLDVRTVGNDSAVAGIDTYKLFASYAYKDEDGNRIDTNYVKVSALNNWVANTASTFSGLALSSVYCLNGGGTSFPITSQSGSTKYTLNASSNALWFTTASGPAGATTRLDVRGVTYQAYPATDMSASWFNIIRKTNEPSSNCYCIKLNNSTTSVDLANYSAYDRVTVIHAQDYGPDYQLYWDGKTKVFPSGLYCELAKVKDDRNQDKWTFLNSGWTFDYWWDWD